MYFIINFIIVSTKKRCLKCNDAQCEHCRCPGYIDCDHKPVFIILLYQGEACKRTKYNKRLVCNNCERRKLEQYFFIYFFNRKKREVLFNTMNTMNTVNSINNSINMNNFQQLSVFILLLFRIINYNNILPFHLLYLMYLLYIIRNNLV